MWKVIGLICGSVAALMYLLCVNAGRISRIEEEWEEERKK